MLIGIMRAANPMAKNRDPRIEHRNNQAPVSCKNAFALLQKFLSFGDVIEGCQDADGIKTSGFKWQMGGIWQNLIHASPWVHVDANALAMRSDQHVVSAGHIQKFSPDKGLHVSQSLFINRGQPKSDGSLWRDQTKKWEAEAIFQKLKPGSLHLNSLNCFGIEIKLRHDQIYCGSISSSTRPIPSLRLSAKPSCEEGAVGSGTKNFKVFSC